MINATHTPGAWATDGREAAWDILDGDNKRIASVWRNIGKPQDARLIAAAPDLLAALSDIILSSDANCGDSLANAIEAARAAIAKAKGEA